MPRAFSSGRRSVSTPVNAAISAVLPWSMCPAVPTVSGGAAPARGSSATRERVQRRRDRGGGLADLLVAEGAGVEQQASLVDAADDRRVAGAPGGGAPAAARAPGGPGPG